MFAESVIRTVISGVLMLTMMSLPGARAADVAQNVPPSLSPALVSPNVLGAGIGDAVDAAGIRAGGSLKAAATTYKMTIRYHTNGETIKQGIAHSDSVSDKTYHSWISSSATTFTAADNGYWWGYRVLADGTSNAPRHLITSTIDTSTTDFNILSFHGWTEMAKTGYHVPSRVGPTYYVLKDGKKIYLSADEGGTYPPTTKRLNGGTQITSDTTVTAYVNWTANTYSVKYNANGGSGTMANSTHTYDTAKALTANAFTRTGYTFSGWNTKADGSGTSYANKASVKNLTTTNNGAVTLYAQWTAAKMTIQYHVNGGTITTNTSNATRYRAASSIVQRSTDSGSTWANYTSSIASTDTYKDLFNVGTPGITRTGYHISGTTAWKTTSGLGTSGAVVVSQQNTASDATNPATTKRINGGTQISSNVTKTLYVNWIANTYSVKYNANGGSGTMANSSHTYNTAKALTANAFTRTGYVFAGWNTKADGSGTSYSDGESVKNLTATDGGTVNLYAQWSDAPYYTVAFDANGGSGDMPSMTYLVDAVSALPAPTFTREGYSVTSWNTEEDGTGASFALDAEVKNLDSATANSTKTLYAQWTPNTYTIAYAGMSGASYGTNHPTTATYGTAFTVDNPTKAGYTFAGWTISGMDGTTHTYDETETTATSLSGCKATSFENLRAMSGEVTFTATWTASTHPVNYAGMGGASFGASHPASATYDSTFAVDNPKKTGYDFGGWDITGMTSGVKHYRANGYRYVYRYTDEDGSHDETGDFDSLPEAIDAANEAWGEDVLTMDAWVHASGGDAIAVEAEEGATSTGASFAKSTSRLYTNLSSTTSPVTFTATWDAHEYGIAYEGMDGASFGTSHPATASYGSAFTVSNPSKDGYEFTGWDISGLGVGDHVVGSRTVTTKAVYTVGSTPAGGERTVALTTEDLAAAVAKANELNVDVNDVADEFTVDGVGFSDVVYTGDGGDVWIEPELDGDELTGVRDTTFQDLSAEAGDVVTFTATWEANQVVIEVPTVIPFTTMADGTLLGPTEDAVRFVNTGTTDARLKAVEVVPSDEMTLSAEPSDIGEFEVTFGFGNGETLNLWDYAEKTELDASPSWRIPKGETLEFESISGRVYAFGEDVDLVDYYDMADVNWTFTRG